MMDTNDLFFNNEIDLTFIEPFPDNRLRHLIGKAEEQVKIIEEEVQAVNLDLFKGLETGDILFVDSSHVVKTGSDVHFILKKVLPILKKGVLIHFHDIHFPFEYPKDWVLNGFGWNEVYYIHAFLMYNGEFKIRMFNDFLSKCHSEKITSIPFMPKAAGSSLWLEKAN
ncbi:class I SAM-dependent methyltransferase [Salinimicrobium terrae]|uniref:class I SAM-dependent methyltransferase n=1 Tax=Salinimicrobium terrae TaxID=470866 RepID=UPI00146E2724|nr:class I SAM-dependent methyltransferase [Salinimicrobium terrae]